jgi:hypothetical protein
MFDSSIVCTEFDKTTLLMKNLFYFLIILIIVCCKSPEAQPEITQFDFSDGAIGNASFNALFLSKDKKVVMKISADPIKLKVVAKEQIYNFKDYVSSDLSIQITQYQNIIKNLLPEIPPPVNPEKPNPVLKTWNVIDGTISIKLDSGQPKENRQCNNPYNVTLKLVNVKFISSDKKESFILKNQNVNNLLVGWCPE